MSVFNSNKTDYSTNSKIFLDESGSVNIARYDKLKYKQFDLLTEKQLGFFWRPESILLTKDSKDFRDMSEHEQFIFTSNLKRQILLDSVQGRAPFSLIPIVSLPEVERFIATWGFSETIHSASYSHIIRNVYSNPSIVFDEILKIEEVVDCAKDISKYYDDLITKINRHSLGHKVDLYDLKKSLWLCLHSINALEGVRFYVSFACSWSFAELKKMEGNANIIKLIARDENLHLAFTQKLINLLPEDDADFIKIKEETKEQCNKLFIDVVDQEKAWANYLFKDGSMIGLNADILKQYVEFIATKRMRVVDLESPYKITTDPLPWTKKWISGQDVQAAPQETNITTYTIGEMNMDIDENTFKNFEL